MRFAILNPLAAERQQKEWLALRANFFPCTRLDLERQRLRQLKMQDATSPHSVTGSGNSSACASVDPVKVVDQNRAGSFNGVGAAVELDLSDIHAQTLCTMMKAA
jgi:hypothetical protein